MRDDLRLDRAVEAILTLGLTIGALLLLAGLILGHVTLLRWGIVALMLTPVGRVVVVTIGMFARRDMVFGVLSLGILLVLATSIIVSLRL
ncbi:MAG: hypothetical protein ACHQNV_10525 [Vicinamibacteria bacterium]